MEKIIQKAIEGGLKEGEKWQFQTANNYWALWLDGNKNEATVDVKHYMMSKDFWQALSKACGWVERYQDPYADGLSVSTEWLYHSLEFHEINLTQGFDSAVSWLSDLVDKK